MKKAKLKEIFIDVFDLDPFVQGKNITIEKITSWDSLSHINLIIAIENKFNVEIAPEEIPFLYSDYNSILEYLKSK